MNDEPSDRPAAAGPMRYVTDIPYLPSFVPELAPEWLDFVALIAGFDPPDRSGGFSWCELGCGRGLAPVIFAATHPEGCFSGIDLMPDHIAAARATAARADLGNVAFHASDFTAADTAEQGRFDYIVAHGVYSWIDAAAHADFLRFIDRHLAPGGLVYVSYNAMPGWAADLPLQYLLRNLAEAEPGASDARVLAAAGTVQSLLAAGAPPLRASPIAAGWADAHAKRSTAYLAHEFLAPAWRAWFVTEVRGVMASIGLEPAGSTRLMENFDSFVLTRAAREALEDFADPDRRELVRDYFLGQRFRSDVFVREPRRLMAEERGNRLLDTPIRLLRPASLVEYRMRGEAGTVGFDNRIARAVVAALATGPRRLRDCGDGTILEGDLLANGLALCCAGMAGPALEQSADVARLNQALREEDPELPAALRVLRSGAALRLSRELLDALASGDAGAESAEWLAFLRDQ